MIAEPSQPLTTDAMVALHRLFVATGEAVIDRMCGRYGVDLLGVFGSAARRIRRGSTAPLPRDLDLAVRFMEDQRTLELQDELVRLTGYEAIDLAVLNDANPVLRAEALVGVGLYESTRGGWATAQMAALAERRDTAWLRRLDLELMAA